MNDGSKMLTLAALLTALVALIHAACIVVGAPMYRALGAGEAMAQMAERGDPSPTIITSALVLIFCVWAAYALSGAGKIIRLPLLKTVLCLICAVLLLRAVGFYFIMSAFPDNSLSFWLISSAICLGLGLTYLLGIKKSWQRLSK